MTYYYNKCRVIICQFGHKLGRLRSLLAAVTATAFPNHVSTTRSVPILRHRPVCSAQPGRVSSDMQIIASLKAESRIFVDIRGSLSVILPRDKAAEDSSVPLTYVCPCPRQPQLSTCHHYELLHRPLSTTQSHLQVYTRNYDSFFNFGAAWCLIVLVWTCRDRFFASLASCQRC